MNTSAPPAEKPAARKRLFTALRWIGTLGLGGYIFASTDLSATWSVLREALWLWLAVAAALYVVDRALATLRWMVLIPDPRVREGLFPRALAIYLQSSFLGAVLPATVGMDLIRARMSQTLIGSFATSLGSVIADRFVGVVGLLLAALVGVALFSPLGVERVLDASRTLTAPALWTAAGIVLVALLTVYAFTSPRIAGYLRRGPLFGFLASLAERLAAYRARPAELALGLFIALSQQYLLTTINWLVARSLGLDVSFVTMLWVWPLVMISIRLPISVLGFGVREAVVVGLIGRTGVPESGALALGLASGLLDLVFIGLGGILFLVLPGSLLTSGGEQPRPSNSA